MADVLQTLKSLTGWTVLTDILDIAVVGFIFYRLFIIIKGTRAVQMLIGLAILLLVSVFSQYAELQTLNWLLKNFWTIWVLAIIVLFQPELRRALAQVGQSSLLNPLYKLEETKLLDEVVKAATTLSGKKIGALMVFERETPLKGYIEGGVELGARISKELLNTIFLPYSPLHDGAAVLIDNRLSLAGCFLPLSLNPNLSKSLGTRHRAAVGLTEETDAVVIVVSEETGGISLAVNGELTTGLDAISLRKALGKLFVPGKKPKSRQVKLK